MSVKNRTDEDILAYIRRNSVGGKIAKSLLEIADEVGYSNATVHRVLKRLEAQDLVFVERDNRKANAPSVIHYKGPNKDDELLEEGVRLVNQLKEAADELMGFFHQTSRNLRTIQDDAHKWQEIKDRIVNVIDLPQGQKLMTIAQEDPARHVF